MIVRSRECSTTGIAFVGNPRYQTYTISVPYDTNFLRHVNLAILKNPCLVALLFSDFS